MPPLKLYWTDMAWNDYRDYCDLARPDEIAGMGEIVIEDGKLIVTKLHLIEQEVSPGSADFDDAAYAKWFDEEYCANGGKPENLRLWWHTHPNMGVEFSAKDRNTIKEKAKNCPWFVATVINEKGERQGELIISSPDFLPPIKLTREDFVILRPAGRRDELKVEVEKKVKKHKFTYTSGRSNGAYYGGHWTQDLEDWYGAYQGQGRGSSTGVKHGGFNGLGPKNGNGGGNGKKHDTKPIPVPTVSSLPSLDMEKEDVKDLPSAEVIRENVTADIINNIRYLARGGK